MVFNSLARAARIAWQGRLPRIEVGSSAPLAPPCGCSTPNRRVSGAARGLSESPAAKSPRLSGLALGAGMTQLGMPVVYGRRILRRLVSLAVFLPMARPTGGLQKFKENQTTKYIFRTCM